MNSQFKDAFTFKFNQLNRLNKKPLVGSVTVELFKELITTKNPLVVESIKYCISLGLKP